MTDYNKETVAKLRQVLKDRNIPSTGLTRKAQIIEKLEEWDAQNAIEGEAEHAPEAAEEVEVEVAEPEVEAASSEPPEPNDDAPVVAPGATTEERTEAAEATAPDDVKDNTVIEAQEGNSADSVPKEDPQPAIIIAEEAQIPTESHATDFARPTQTPSPASDEKPSIEKPELLPIPERSVISTADQSRLNTEELEADTRKRKRRSLTPELSAQEVRTKKPRPSEDVVHEVAVPQDEDTVMDQRPPEEAEKELDEIAMEEDAANGNPKIEAELAISAAESKAAPEAEKKQKIDRYRELLKPASEPSVADAPSDIPDDRSVSPALHLATPALYIRNLMRPLRPEPLRAHLVALASPPSTDADPEIISTLFLDNMKTHALVRFASTTAASRVRASLHGTTWPPEGNRKDLWVDFVPDEDCATWIQEEEDAMFAEKEARAAGRPIPAKKFEVVYFEDENGGYTAVFQEVGAGAAAFNPPKGPRRTSQQVSGAGAVPLPTQEIRQNAEASFKTLDELFSSTIAKPKLYFLAVSDERAEARTRDLEAETSRHWTPEEKRKGRGIQASRLDQKIRFTFDEEDRVVEAGGDFGPWTEQSDFRGGRGGGRGGFRGRGRGGWRSGP
ncbi:hypothetical protein DPSP01_005746 [Paraphaeosphaeria sporulosa]|uniref:SAP domain-containing protein n=1 Tax=Paraphaeosphaeria sporulosa TaxID=1460663 RepID=A0A177CCM4_9PLEO|nr:uncharacterized protein CC84DRAFT_1259900 [Paraphaeosphaeria sporulosa]OAG04528.1 hypothetical protein CC84DRAFT_1259900 [Paraphaeosphaeria sporulosa]